jgi:hypothetical protein
MVDTPADYTLLIKLQVGHRYSLGRLIANIHSKYPETYPNQGTHTLYALKMSLRKPKPSKPSIQAFIYAKFNNRAGYVQYISKPWNLQRSSKELQMLCLSLCNTIWKKR